MNSVVLVTGACGFLGRHVCAYLNNVDGHPLVVGTDIRCNETLPGDDFYGLDLRSFESAQLLLQSVHPDYIIHLAGRFSPPDNIETYHVNVLSTLSLLEATRRCVPRAVVVVAGSAAEYGRVESKHLPIHEKLACSPVTMYGLSKHQTTGLVQYYYRVHGICGMVVRPFQLIGKGISEDLAPGAFYQQIRSAIEEGRKTVKVGDLDATRDFLDVRDAVEAVWSLCKIPKGGEVFNLCSGLPIEMSVLLDSMIDHTGADVIVETDESRIRPRSDSEVAYGTYRKINEHCGWKPRRSIEESIQAMFAASS